MACFICTACGMQYAQSDKNPNLPPAQCVICEEERQYVPPRGQSWTTLEALSQSHMNSLREYEPGVIGIGSEPNFAIGQRALLVRTPGGNVLWDCIATLDAATVTAIKGLGGIKAIAISHPHFYTTMVEWARAFDAPIHLNAADQAWIMRPDPAINLWQGDTFKLWDGVTLIRCGGHFEGGSVLHWQESKKGGAGGRGQEGELSAPATSSPSPPTASGFPSCAAIRISFRSRKKRSSTSARRWRRFRSTCCTAIISTA